LQTPRETIYNTLFNLGAGILVNGKPAFITTSRRWKNYSQVPPEQQPAFFQVQRREMPRSEKTQGVSGIGVPAKWELHVDWIVYVNTGGDQNVIPSSFLNPIVDALEAILPNQRNTGPGNPSAQTLGLRGVIDARIIDTEILLDEDVTGEQALALIPVRILAN
jgi:hypothetical protein